MSKREVFSLESKSAELFAELTAEAWADPDLAADLARDKAVTVAKFAKTHGYAVPAGDAIDEFELAENPIGELKFTAQRETAAYTYYTCQSACSPCPTQVTCYTEAATCSCTQAAGGCGP